MCGPDGSTWFVNNGGAELRPDSGGTVQRVAPAASACNTSIDAVAVAPSFSTVIVADPVPTAVNTGGSDSDNTTTVSSLVDQVTPSTLAPNASRTENVAVSARTIARRSGVKLSVDEGPLRLTTIARDAL
jgi:hypothetical protein